MMTMTETINGSSAVSAKNQKTQKKLIRGAFLRLMINNMIMSVTASICGLIDNLFVGRILGSDALAAVGFFSPVTTAAGLSYVIIFGTQVLAGNLIGAGETKKIKKLFVSSFVVLGVIFSVFAVSCIIFNQGLAEILGADGRAYDFLREYIKGFAPGILPQILAAMLSALCSFNNDLKRSYCGIAAMITVNVIGDWLLIGRFGLFGVGLASSISSLACLLVLLPGFFKKNKLFTFRKNSGLDFKLVLQAARRGLPSLMLAAGVIIKNLCFNNALNNSAGAAGVAVAGIMATVSALSGAVPSGCYNAFSSFAGIYYGEEDRESLLDLTRIALRIGVISCAATTALIMLFSSPLSKLFLPNDASAQSLAIRMFILTFTYLVPNVIYNIFLQSYRAQNRMLLVNIMSFAETALIGLFTLSAIGFFGTDAAWLSNTIIDILCIITVMISVIVYQKRFDLSIASMLKLPSGFGAEKDSFITFSANRIEDVTQAYENIIGFCEKNSCSEKTAYHVVLCIEEMAGNVFEHGFNKSKNYYVDIRIVSKDDILTVRVRDNCKEFDPRKRADFYDPKHPEKNIGIRIVTMIAQKIDYYNNAGINTLIMKFPKT